MNAYERLAKVRDKIDSHRAAYMSACRHHLDEIFFYSLEGEEKSHANMMEELETALTLLYRFDRRLQEAKSLEALLEQLDGNESSAGPTG